MCGRSDGCGTASPMRSVTQSATRNTAAASHDAVIRVVRAPRAPICRVASAQGCRMGGGLSPCDKHLAVRQQRRRMTMRGRAKIFGAPSNSRSPDRIVPRCLVSWHSPPATSTCPFGSNVAVWLSACSGHAAGRRPHPSRRIV